MPESEKITINIWPVDLGQIDLLVDQGFYSNRTDFIRIAIRNQLQSHQAEAKQFTTEHSFVMGVLKYDRKYLEKLVREAKTLDVKVIGGLIIAEDVTVDLARATIKKVNYFGILKAPQDVKTFILSLQQKQDN